MMFTVMFFLIDRIAGILFEIQVGESATDELKYQKIYMFF